ncbi:transposase [Streptomyces shenzhenensis]|uniref:transposase n=1 Tax=Streptomyces shenzhenensis TaxID=943815 RepID=UPI0033F83CEA
MGRPGHPDPIRRPALRPCELRTSRTRSRTGCNLTLRPKTEHHILQQARIEQDTGHQRRRYGHRAGVEGTVPQGIQVFGRRRSRYRGLARTRCSTTSPAPP